MLYTKPLKKLNKWIINCTKSSAQMWHLKASTIHRRKQKVSGSWHNRTKHNVRIKAKAVVHNVTKISFFNKNEVQKKNVRLTFSLHKIKLDKIARENACCRVQNCISESAVNKLAIYLNIWSDLYSENFFSVYPPPKHSLVFFWSAVLVWSLPVQNFFLNSWKWRLEVALSFCYVQA